MLLIRIFMAVLLAGSLWSCQTDTTSPDSDSADFGAFYQRFLADSLYQMRHITFPLEGLPPHAATEELSGDFRWQPGDWVVHRVLDQQQTGFESALIRLDDDLIVERITHKREPYAMERRFAKMGQEWYLIYYAGLNEVAQ